MTARSVSVAVRLVAIDPPFSAADPVLFGPQRGQLVEAPVPATRTTAFDIEVDVVAASNGRDFRGPYVHGRPGDRFLYLSWGLGHTADEFAMFARAKLWLANVPDDLLQAAVDGAVLVCELAATNAKGEPASGGISSPDVTWTLEHP